MRRTLTDTEYQEQLNGWREKAFRAELQAQYWVAEERAAYEWFVEAKPPPGPEIAGTAAWLRRVKELAAAGKQLRRVRVHHDPPTDYQRFVRSVSQGHAEAGEQVDYLTAAVADAAGLLGVADRDWWLFDDERLVVLTHDEEGRRIHTELITDKAELDRARAWWDLAAHTTRGENA